MPYLRTLPIALPALALLGGCAQIKNPKPTPPSKDDSQAMRIMKGANTADAYNLQDISRSRVKEAAQDNKTIGRSLGGAAGVGSMAQAGAGMADLAGGGAMFLTALGSGPAYGANWLDAYAWVPQEKASTPKEAAKVIEETFARGLEKTFSEKGWRKVEVKKTDLSKGKDTHFYYQAKIPDSDESPIFDFSMGSLQYTLTKKTVPEPAFLGGDGSVWGLYRKTGNADIGGIPLGVNDASETGSVALKRHDWQGDKLAQYGLPKSPSAFVKELSGNLPEWIAFYIGPDWDKAKEYPRVYWQGKELVFVEPAQK